ncbi:transporter substrate-binding domain-containing protein, partial [Staphylococcus devriesei]
MKYFSKLIVIAILISMTLIYIQPMAQADEDATWKRIKESGELKVGLSADYAPLEFEKTVNGKSEYEGVDIELAKKIAKDNNVKLKIVNMQFDSLLGALKTGKIDLIISVMTSTPERKKEVDFSEPYMETSNTLLIRKDDLDKYHDLKDFSKKKIGAQKGTEQEKIAQTEIDKAEVSSLDRLPDAILALKSKKIDGLVIEKPVAEAYIKQNKELTFAKVSFNEAKKPTVIAVPKQSPMLLEHVNKTISEVKDKNLINSYMDKT